MFKKEVSSLTGLRAFAALWVGVHHAISSLEGMHLPDSLLISRFIAKGWLGVDLFFVLSGFILAYSYQERFQVFRWATFRSFLLRRFARVYPAHIFTLSALAAMVIVASSLGVFSDPENKYNFKELLSQVFLLHGISSVEPRGWNVPSWSISSEALAYIVFPLLIIPIGRVKGAWANLGLLSGVLALSIGLALLLNDGSKFMLDFRFSWFRIISEFSMGLVLFNVASFLSPGKKYAYFAAASVLCIFLQGSVQGSFYDFMYLVYFMALILSLALAPSKGNRSLATSFGEISYSFYLVHSLIIILLNQLIRRSSLLGQSPLISICLFIVVSQSAAWVMYAYIETPVRSMINAWDTKIQKPKLTLVEGLKGAAEL